MIERDSNIITWHWCHFNALTTRQLYAILQCRQAVFSVEQAIVYNDCDDIDQFSWHLFGQTHAGEIAACLRVIPPGIKYPEASIGRVLTTPNFRRLGLGRDLMRRAFLHINEELGPTPIKISAQKYLEKFYSDFGFKTISETYIEDGIEHVGMLRLRGA